MIFLYFSNMSFIWIFHLLHLLFDYLFLLSTCSHWGSKLLSDFSLHSLTGINYILLMDLWMNFRLSSCQILSVRLEASLDLFKFIRIRCNNSNVSSINLLHVVFDIFWILIVSFKLREHFSYIINHQLWQLLIVILNHKAEEFSIVIVNNIAYFLFKWKRG